MIQRPIDDAELQAGLAGLEADGLTLFTLGGPDGPAGGELRGAVLHGSRLVNDMRANHRLGSPETLILGRAYLAAAILGSTMKGEDRVSLRVEGSGPAEGYSVEGRSIPGEAGAAPSVGVRGYLFREPIPLAAPVAAEEAPALVGPGTLSLTRFIATSPRPFTGTIATGSGRLAEELAAYYLESEQTPSAFRLSVKLDAAGRAVGAGGLFIQALPGAREDFAARAEAALIGLPSIGEWFAAGRSRAGLLESGFAGLGLVLREERSALFSCACDRARFAAFLAAANLDFLEDLAARGPWPVEAHCHNCATTYAFERDEVEAMLAKRRREAAE